MKQLTSDHELLEQNIGFQSKKLDKKEDYYKEQISQINKKAYNLEKQKD